MGTRTISLALVCLLLPVGAWADRHRAGFGAAPTYVSRSALWGMQLSGDKPVWGEKTEGQPAHVGTLSLVAELSLVAGDHEGATLAQFTFVAGPRFTFNHFNGNRRFQFFGQVLVGGAQVRMGEANSSWAGAFGVGVDIPLESVARDDDHPWLALRVQYNECWINTDSTDWYPQFSAGVVFRLNRHP